MSQEHDSSTPNFGPESPINIPMPPPFFDIDLCAEKFDIPMPLTLSMVDTHECTALSPSVTTTTPSTVATLGHSTSELHEETLQPPLPEPAVLRKEPADAAYPDSMPASDEVIRIPAAATEAEILVLSMFDPTQTTTSPVSICSGGLVLHPSSGLQAPFTIPISPEYSQATSNAECQDPINDEAHTAGSKNSEETRVQGSATMDKAKGLLHGTAGIVPRGGKELISLEDVAPPSGKPPSPALRSGEKEPPVPPSPIVKMNLPLIEDAEDQVSSPAKAEIVGTVNESAAIPVMRPSLPGEVAKNDAVKSAEAKMRLASVAVSAPFTIPISPGNNLAISSAECQDPINDEAPTANGKNSEGTRVQKSSTTDKAKRLLHGNMGMVTKGDKELTSFEDVASPSGKPPCPTLSSNEKEPPMSPSSITEMNLPLIENAEDQIPSPAKPEVLSTVDESAAIPVIRPSPSESGTKNDAAEGAKANVGPTSGAVSMPDAVFDLVHFNWMAKLPARSLFPFFPSKTLEEFSPGQAEIYDSEIHDPDMPLNRALFGHYGLSQAEKLHLADLNEFLLKSPSFQLLDRSIFLSNTEDFGREGMYPRYALRFLQFNNYSIEDTAAHIMENAVWLSSQGRRYLSRSQVHVELDAGCFYIHGFDHKLRPLLICDVTRARTVLTPIQVETLANYWLLFFRQHLAIENKVEQMTALVYLTSEDIQRGNQGDTWFEEMTEMFCRVSRRFPDYVHRFYMLISDQNIVTETEIEKFMGPGLETALRRHVPPTFRGFRRLMKRFVFLGCRWGEILNGILQPAQVPKYCGGTAADIVDSVQYQLPMSPSMDALFMSEPKTKIQLGDCLCYGDPRIGSGAATERKPPPLTDLEKCMAYLLETAALAPEIATVCEEIEAALNQCPYVFDNGKPNMMQVARVIKGCSFNRLESLMLLRLDDMSKPSPLLLRIEDGNWPKELVQSQCVYWYGRDRQRRPILVIRAQRLLDEVKDASVGIDWVSRWLNYGIEYLLQEGTVIQWNVLVDLKNASALNMDKGLPAVPIIQRYYKERLNEVWVLNHTFWTRRAVDAWKAASGVEGKLIYVNNLSDLRPKILLTQVPADLGGAGRQISDAGYPTICMPSQAQ